MSRLAGAAGRAWLWLLFPLALLLVCDLFWARRDDRHSTPSPSLIENQGSTPLVRGAAGPAGRPEVKASKPWRIAFIPKFKYFGETGALSSYWQPAWDSAQKAGVDFGVSVRLITSSVHGRTDAEYVEPQIRLIADLISRHDIDGMVIAAFDSDRLAPIVDKAVAAGIPTIAMDTPINSDRVLTFVSFDNVAAGRELGCWVAGRLRGGGRALMLEGPLDQQNAADRRKGFLAGLQAGNVELLNAKSGDWETAPARRIVEEWLREYPNVDAIIAANDNMAVGAVQAITAAHRTGILVTGFDCTQEALALIRSGGMAATVDQAPGRQSRLAIQLMVRHLETGEALPPIVYLPGTEIVDGTADPRAIATPERR